MGWTSRIGQALGYVRKLGQGLQTARRIGSAVNRELGGKLTQHPLGAKINELSKQAIQGTNLVQTGLEKADQIDRRLRRL
eukprot:765729-Hanusia_phi.AAC.1